MGVANRRRRDTISNADNGPTLLVGCAPEPLLSRIVADLRDREPGGTLWMLALDDALASLADRLIPYVDHGGIVANLRDRRRLLGELRAARPAEVVIPVPRGQVFTISNLAVLGCLVGAPIRVVDENLDYRWERPGLRTVGWYLVQRTLARLPRPGRAAISSRSIRGWPWLILAYWVLLPFRVVYSWLRALWLLGRWLRRAR